MTIFRLVKPSSVSTLILLLLTLQISACDNSNGPAEATGDNIISDNSDSAETVGDNIISDNNVFCGFYVSFYGYNFFFLY